MIRFTTLLNALLTICAALPLMAQSDSQAVPLIPSGFPCLTNDWTVPCWYQGPAVIDEDSLFEASMRECDRSCEAPDFDTHILLIQSYGGDCHMRVRSHIWWDESQGILTLRGYNIWGGCRAGGQKLIALLVEKPKIPFTVAFEEIQVDSWEEYEEVRKKKVGRN